MMPSTYAPPVTEPIDFGICWLPSYCPDCLLYGCGYREAATSESAITWRPGAKQVICDYECPRCGHTWTDRWPSTCAFPAEIS
ncbi:hypothetical protein [Nocardia testacea]|uniref:hypothetical protein n=1 Tax=Nocardia testacea TaxID=248551 RepID=UPI00031D2916|nr:hypothetical protein [Nocardia testacea]